MNWKPILVWASVAAVLIVMAYSSLLAYWNGDLKAAGAYSIGFLIVWTSIVEVAGFRFKGPALRLALIASGGLMIWEISKVDERLIWTPILIGLIVAWTFKWVAMDLGMYLGSSSEEL